MFEKVAFTVYPVADMAAARRFYEETLGLPPAKAGPASPWVEYDLPGGGCFAITTVMGKPSAPSNVMIAFEVTDLDALVADLKAKGATFKSGDDLIHSPVCRMSVVADADGNAVLLHQLKSKPA